MLTLIVVVAAGSFAVFISQKQKEVQDQQIYELHKQQEQLVVDSMTPDVVAGSDSIAELNFTISSGHQLESTVLKVAVNGHVLRQFWEYHLDLASGKWELRLLHWSDNFIVEPREQLYLNVSAADFFESGVTFDDTRIIKIEISTSYQNIFSKIFMPPSAVAAMKTEALWNGTAYENYIVMDATESTAQDGSSLVYYDWNVTRKLGGDGFQLHGVKSTVQFHMNGEYWINLTVTDIHGMVGRASLSYNRA